MENHKKIKPLGDRVLLKSPPKSESRTSSGIILNENITRGECIYSEVLSTGTGIFSQTGDRIPMTVKVGDQVMYKKDMAGDLITIEDEDYILVREHELLMVIEK